LDLRYFYLSSIYNTYQDFTWENLEQGKTSRINLIKKITELKNKLVSFNPNFESIKNYEDFKERILTTLK